MPPSQTYSFEPEDGHNHSFPQSGQQQIYHDSPQRHIISPPPTYTSPAPPEPLSPVPLSHTRSYSRHDSGRSIDDHREQQSHRYTDRSPSPPPLPPQHRTSPARHSRHNSTSKRSLGATTASMEDYRTSPQEGYSRSQPAPDRLYTSGSYERRSFQPGFPQPGHIQSHSPPPISGSHIHRPTSRLHDNSYGSNLPLAAGAATPGSMTPSDVRSSRYSGRSIPLDEYPYSHPYRSSHHSYNDSPYHNSSHNLDVTVSSASINPQNIADDGEDDFAPLPRNAPMQASHNTKPGATAAGGAATAGGLFGGFFGNKGKGSAVSTSYQPVDTAAEKTAWLSKETRKRKRNGWLCGIGIGVVILIAIVAGIVGGVMSTHAYKTGGNSSINNADDDTATNGDLDINSAEIKKLLNNPNLHKVFPGMDYTPWGVQYPLCETYAPSQNNVTRDMAVLSQLTNTVRLYGTDCNQTEMVLHAIDKLKLKNMKVWLGVWIDNNQTTGDRQLAKMYDILSQVKDKSIFKGAIIGNEALYRAGADKATSKQELIQTLKNVRSNFTTLGYSLPVATSDLGDNWDADLVQVVDYVMSNIHPFFAGVTAEVAAAWTWNFWQTKDVVLTQNYPKVKQIISETGWPSSGGKDCGGSDGSCATGQSGAIASVDNMNTFMNTWVCQALTNGTDYFWFEAFDEPWKVQFNTPGKEWEDKWGLMDSGRNLKSGIKIPSCGGKTVS